MLFQTIAEVVNVRGLFCSEGWLPWSNQQVSGELQRPY